MTTKPPKPPRAFAAVNFFLADVAGGLGPFLPTWLAVAMHMDAQHVGLVMTFGGVAGLIFNIPGGALVDRLGSPKLMLAGGSGLILAGTFTMVAGKTLVFALLGLTVTALGGAVIGPAIAAASIGYVGKDFFPLQQGRNQAFSNTGNVAAALLVLLGAARLGVNAPLVVLGGMAALTLAALLLLPRPAGNSRNLGLSAGGKPLNFTAILGQKPLLLLALCLLCFHLGNGAMLPLLGQRLARTGHGQATEWMSACVIVSQLAMAGIAIFAGRVAEARGRLPLLVAACLVLPLRGIMACYGQSPLWLVPIEILDAFGAGTLGVITAPLVADLSWGSGRTQTTLGAVMMVQGLGAAFSNALGGGLVALAGWQYAFLGLSVPPLLAIFLAVWLRRHAGSAAKQTSPV